MSPPKPSKRKSNSKPTSVDLKGLDDKWAQRFARLEFIILSKSFAVPVEPVQKPAEFVTSEKPWFDPGASTSQMSTGVVTQSYVYQCQSCSGHQGCCCQHDCYPAFEAPGTKIGSAASMTATWPVEAAGMMRVATQPVEAPGARSEVHSQPTSTSSMDVSSVDWSLTSKITVAAANTGVSDSRDELNSEPESPAVTRAMSDRDPPKDDELDQEIS